MAATSILTSETFPSHGVERDSDIEEESEEEFVPAPLSWFEQEEPEDENKNAVTNRPSSDTLHDKEAPRVVAEPTSPVYSYSPPAKSHTRRRSPRVTAIGAPLPSPSWKEISSQVLPSAARELLSSSVHRIVHTARLSYARGRWSRKYSEIGNNAAGYYRFSSCSSGTMADLPPYLQELPPFSSLPWVDRQLVQEWRTYSPQNSSDDDGEYDDDPEAEEMDFDRARTLVPMPIQRPVWAKSELCLDCHKPFGPTRLRHHCRLCGYSFCQSHSSYSHSLPHLSYDPEVPERVCDSCKAVLLEQNLAERVAWRLARCRDYQDGTLAPYFETGIDTVEEVALRITHAALAMAKSIPLGAQATVAVETVDVLRKHGLNGIYTIMLRQEFLAAADLLRKALGINQTAWPLSVHELSAAIFYALAQHRAMRGMNPEREHVIHGFRRTRSAHDQTTAVSEGGDPERIVEKADVYNNSGAVSVANLVSNPGAAPGAHPVDASVEFSDNPDGDRPFELVCDPISDSVLASLIFYAPMALNFIYATKEVDMQLLAAQQGWRLLYASLGQDSGRHAGKDTDRPGSALFVHEEQKVACVAVRGTATIQDVITDIRQMPVPFPESDTDNTARAQTEDDWTTVASGNGLAVCGMATAAMNIYREHIDSLLFLAQRGYRIRMTGHSLGGGVATLLGVLVLRDLKQVNGLDSSVRVFAYGTPSCVDDKFANFVEDFVTTAVLHDDVIPRLTPSSCRGLLKHLLHIRETWVKDHFTDDLMAITERAKTAWAPRWRGSFTLSSSSSIKRYCRKQIQYGKRKLRSVKEKLAGDIDAAEDQDGVERNSDHNCFGDGVVSFSSLEGPNGIEATLDAADDVAEASEDEVDVEPRFLVDYMGGLDSRSEGVVIDGDEFFDPDENLVESDDENDSRSSDPGNNFDDIVETTLSDDAFPFNEGEVEARADVFDEAEQVPADGLGETPESLEKLEGVDDDESPGAVILEETPLPRMYIPGKIVHMYSYRGVYKAAQVPRGFRELRRISLAGNMLLDHKSKAYYEALVEVHTVRAAQEHPPRWTAFDEDVTW
jgi:hypothetical protein